jgi:hypothetical protein
MTKHQLRRFLTSGSAAIVFAALFAALSVSTAFAQKKAPAAHVSAPKAAPASHGSMGGGAKGPSGVHGGGPSASHGPTANGSHGPMAGGAHGPTANGSHGPMAGGAHGPTAGGAHGMNAGGGGMAHGNSAGGRSSFGGHNAPRGSNERVARNGSAVRTRSDGRVSDLHDSRRGMDVHHGLGGGRRVSVDRPGHGRIYAERGRPGYVQRGYGYRGHDYGRRAYYYHGHEYNRYYRGYGYRGMYLNVYAPGYYYGAGFYGWAYNPWAVPIAYGWGWGGSPWYGFYGGYFTPYPVYASAAFWLTDYIISQDLAAAYAARQEAGESDGDQIAAGGPPMMSPEVKQEITDEVKNQIALENAEGQQNSAGQDVDPASSGIARLLSDGRPHVFVVGDPIDVTDSTGQECTVSDGDALQLQTAPPPDATDASLIVLAAKGGRECRPTSTVTVQLTDLQEMQNHMRETIDKGLQDLQAKQGTGGLPPAPPSARTAPTQPAYASAAPPPDPTDASTIQQQDQQADQAEQEADSGAAPATGPAAAEPAPPPPPAATASVTLGQSLDQVKSALGQPLREADLGSKVILYYNGMKVTLKNGKVTDVE